MSDIIAIVLPIFALIGLGFLAAKIGLMSERAGDGLADYVFALAVPALIFRMLSESTAPLNSSPWGYWVTYFAAAAVVWAGAMLISSRVLHREQREGVIHGFCSAQSNTVFLGIPLILRAYGDAGAVPLFLLLAIHLPIMMGVAAILIEAADPERSGGGLRRFFKTLLTHPILLALAAGVAAQLTGVKAPASIKPILDALATSASPVALVSMGIALARYGFRSDPEAASISAFLKLMVHPALVFVIGTWVFALEPVFTGVAVLFAALPSGINGYMIASRYKIAEGFASNAIAFSTAFSVFTVAIWLWVLGVG
ncbi:AEC family transporter [Flaviflagellibacter deserti]|uniref:AEC family transporter n=1 Tax=Flaviflagellibacter deserti TaxID=2267266 RepID=A0ABV9Z653_9HYPH